MTVPEKHTVEEVTNWLRIFDDGTVDRAWTGPPEALPLMRSVQPYHVPAGGITLYELPGDPAFRIYLPSPPRSSELPVLLHFHGGGFCVSNFSWVIYHHFYSRLAAALPAVVVSVDLPLAPEHRLPAAIDSGCAALQHLRSIARGESAASYVEELLRSTADFSRVFLIGDSSGGNLVHLVAARAGEEAEECFWSPLKIAGGILIHPAFVRSTRSRSEIENDSQSVFISLEMIDKFLALALPEGANKDHPYTCPMGEAAEPPLESLKIPPLMVAVAEKDLMRDTNLEYCEALLKAGKEVEVVTSEGMSHAFHLNKFAVEGDPTTGRKTEELLMAINEFVGRH